MIADKLQNSSLYESIHPGFKAAFNFIRSLDSETKEGEYQIQEGIKAFVSEYHTGPTFKHEWESHKKYIDIQFCLKGKERLQYSPLDDRLHIREDKLEESDVIFYSGKGDETYIQLQNQMFVVLFPDDAHAPQLMVDKPEFIKKVVVKVPVNSIL